MDNSKLFLYAALAFVGLLIWQQWQADFGPKPVPVAQTQTTTQAQAPSSNSTPSQNLDSKPIEDLPGTASIGNNADQNAPAADNKGQLIKVDTDVLEVLISTQGGVIESVKLKDFPVDVNHKNEYLELIYNRKDSLYVIQNGLQSAKNPAPNHYSMFTADKYQYTLQDGQQTISVPLSWTENGIQVVKTYQFERGNHLISLDQKVQNNSSETWSGSQYRQIQRSKPLKKSKILYTYTGAVVYNKEIKYEKVKFKDMEEKPFQQQSVGGWAAMIQHYFLSAWIAQPGQENLLYSIANTKRNPTTYTIGMRSTAKQIAPGANGEFKAQLYVGPKRVKRLAAIAPGLELTVDYGVLTFLSKPMYWLLSFYHSIVGNWGFAIILLTLTVKGLFFKLSETSYRSMAKMRKVGPRLKTLKERFGDDRQKMNQAMMELYKTEKINPMGGCLPMVVQIPVFLALYWALLESVDLRQAPFIFWIHDLSVMDPYYVLPLLMGISMLVQQKLNPAPPDPIQAKVMMALPVVFTVFFAFFPAGLVLYWVSNNTLSITQQWIITKRIEAGDKK
jgi:YidC/Oxa1 family membrane protein insertase